MNRLDKEGATVPVSVKMPVAMRDALDRQIVEHGYANRSEAARALIERGLNGKVRAAKARPKATVGCPHPVARRIGTGCGACGAEEVT